MKTKDRQYWNNIQIQEDIEEWAKQNHEHIKDARENFESLVNSGKMSFSPRMAYLFCKVHNASQSAENNIPNYKFAIEVLASIESRGGQG
jgi:hypothetical protein